MFDATIAADPPDVPPGIRVVSCGFLTGPNAEFSLDPPIANSSMLVLPSVTMPAAAQRSTTCASYGATKSASIREPQVVRQPRAQKISLCAIGNPVSGPLCPAARRASAARACARLRSASTLTKQPSSLFNLLILLMNSCVNSTLEQALAASRAAISRLQQRTIRTPRPIS